MAAAAFSPKGLPLGTGWGGLINRTIINTGKDRRLAGKRRRIARKAANRENLTVAPYDRTRDPEVLMHEGLPELRNLARGLHLHRYSKLNKAELIQLIVNR